MNNTSHTSKVFIIVCLLLISAINSYAQWEMAKGLDGGRLTRMVSIDTMLFAYADNRGVVAKSDNSDWELIFDDPEYCWITKAGSCIFLTSQDYDTCYRSCNNGLTWENVPGLYGVSPTWSIDTVIFFFNNSGFRRSFDFGASHEKVELPSQYMLEHLMCDDSLLYIHYKEYEHNEVYYSDDYGSTWDTIPTNGLFPEYHAHVEQIKYLNGVLWAQTDSGGAPYSRERVFIYSEELEKWIEVTNNLPCCWPHFGLYAYHGDIFCSIYSFPVFKYNDEDSSWVEFSDASKQVWQILEHKDELFFATEQGACSLDSNGNWTTYYTGLQYRDISSISILNNRIYVTANNELFVSGNDGHSFTRNSNTFGYKIITTDSVFYMISTHEFKMSWDQGNTWHSFSDGIHNYYTSSVTELNISNDYYYLGTSDGFFRSPVDSIAWTMYGYPFDSWFFVHQIEIIDKTMFVSGGGWYGGGMYFSYDNGNQFYSYDEFCYLNSIDRSYYMLRDSIYYSDDLAFSWNLIPVSESGYTGYCIDKQDNTIILGGHDYRNFYLNYPFIQMTMDNGEHWIDLIDNLPVQVHWEICTIRQLKLFDYRLLVGNPGYGLWYRDDVLTGVLEDPVLNSENNSDVKIYPNPAKGYLVIEANNEIYTVRIINQTGLLVFSKNGICDNRMRIKLPGLKDGIYVVSIESEFGIWKKKFVVVN